MPLGTFHAFLLQLGTFSFICIKNFSHQPARIQILLVATN